MTKKDLNMNLSIIVPSTTSAFELIKFLKEEVMNNQNTDNLDMFATGAIYSKIGLEKDIKFSRYISYNPPKAFFGFWSPEDVIPNCSLLVLSHNKLMILKENWSKWYFSVDVGLIRHVLDEDAQKKAQEEGEMISMA